MPQTFTLAVSEGKEDKQPIARLHADSGSRALPKLSEQHWVSH